VAKNPIAVTSPSTNDCRLDKWLWSVRVFKTRPEATDACRAGKVLVGTLEAKPGRDVHVGEIVSVKVGLVQRTLKIIGLPRTRVGAKLLPGFMEDLTPAAEYERARQAGVEHMLARERGRPTKKDRREISRLFGFE
jgi:ribosome-associated heat shock protein Hsp15